MTTSRDRFVDTLDFRPPGRPWVRWGAFLWDETVERWRQEGWDGRPLDETFELDRLVRVDPWYGPVPEFTYEVISEDRDTVTYVNHEGIVMREFKKNHDMNCSASSPCVIIGACASGYAPRASGTSASTAMATSKR